ncbi:hypothetical protein PENANT_c027G00697 [Penicillium antarcticum]|uniref:Protein arginine N-methyltransferase n=1 Tax=Penicillium antarcticum TaxID=416450 RepID=A0A1V6PWS5_9EURO|nr:hypothetical protein PENANT_c027G00697 [Penicillium antarcticum]
MENHNHSEDPGPAFCIGHHEHNRLISVTPEVIQQVHESNYDMMTVPITTSHFHSRVLGLLSNYLATLQSPSYDSIGTMATTQNTRPLVVPPLSKADSYLTPNDATSQLVGVTSSWIDLCSPDPLIADLSRQVLMLEVAYAAFCGIGYLLISGPKLHHGALHSEGVIYYARTVQDALSLGPYIQFHIWLQMVDNPEVEVDTVGDLAPLARAEYLEPDEGASLKVDPFGTWDAWDAIRKTCKYHTRLFVALAMPKQLPSLYVQSRWHSEPVHLLTIDSSSFLKNQKGYPVLAKSHQALIAKMMRLRTAPWILLCGVGPIPGLEGIDSSNQSRLSGSDYPSLSQANKKYNDPTPHLSYIRNLQQRQPPRTAIERFGVGYQDYLQAPLQPLTVNLESITYEVFEKDPIKYEWYEKAITKALRDWADQKKPTSHPDGKVVLAVVGAGRGPLVTRALKASAAAGVEIDMWAVEKNQNAFVLLQRHNETIWDNKVTLVQSDMRSWKGPLVRPQQTKGTQEPVGDTLGIEDSLLYTPKMGANDPGRTTESKGPGMTHTHVDIIVSELLGSFADNELSPECLDGVNDLINPTHGISIPASYSAHFTPVSAPKLHADVVHQTVSNPAAPETPYVVMLHAIDFLSTTDSPTGGESSNANNGNRASTPSASFTATEFPTPNVQTAWSFSHPNLHIPPQSPMQSTISNAHNVRQTRLSFPAQNRGACHGLAGYFETVLYGDVELSTNPVTMDAKSASMISWFPIYFPLKTPLNVPENGEIVVTMYRQTDDRKVWYEWMVEVYALERTSTPSVKATPAAGNSRVGSPSVDNLKPKDNAGKPNSRSGYRRVRVGISDLHSSIKDGCLM